MSRTKWHLLQTETSKRYGIQEGVFRSDNAKALALVEDGCSYYHPHFQ